MCTYVHHEVMLGRGKGRGVVLLPLPMYLFQTLPAPYARVDVVRGPYSKDFARGRILLNNDIAINIQS